ncbi:MAG: hypothetical protein RI897_172 [Verrucomicrobiota bacterium]
MSRALDIDGAEVESDDVESGFCAAEDSGGGSGEEVVTAELADEVTEDGDGGGSAEGSDEGHGEEF